MEIYRILWSLFQYWEGWLSVVKVDQETLERVIT